MAVFTPTPSQKNAMEAPIMDLLVSAAAGSGKTAVLTQRILRLVTSEEGGIDISRMLVVTFTKAAAAELRSRIAKALREELIALRQSLASGEADEMLLLKEDRLLTALDRLESAEISTIHSFCYHLVKKHVAELGLSASLRIGEEAECKLLMMRTMEEAVDLLYEEDPDFPLFAENLIELRDNRLSETLLGFYDKFSSLPDGIASIAQNAEMLVHAADAFGESPFAKTILDRLDRFFTYYQTIMAKALEDVRKDEAAIASYEYAFSEDLRFLDGWESLKKQDYDFVVSAVTAYEPPRIGNYRGKKPDFIERAAALRKEFTEALKEIKSTYLLFTKEEVAQDAKETAFFVKELYSVLLTFERRYTEEKLRYGILDYNDLERYSHKLLIKDGRPTPLAESIRQKYDAIFIDEYQDTNELQDAIFSAISRNNRFMVGDIKQSIYGFRGAMPEIFSHYRSSFPEYQEGAGQKEATIFLSENFRSDKSVIDYSNRVFETLFHNNSGKVPYLSGDALACTRKAEEDAMLPVRYLLVDQRSLDENGKPLSEPEVVAREILSLIQSSVDPSEVVILMRNMTKADQYKKALASLSVSCINDKDSESLFDCTEVLLLVALLNVIDNPTRDIYLAAVLKSPLFGFTLGELVTLRRLAPAVSLYASLLLFLQKREELSDGAQDAIVEKIEAFLRFLEKARRFAEMKSADKVIRYLLSVTPIRAIATKEVGNADSISAFYEFARRYESSGFRGVHGLVRRIREITSTKGANPPKVSQKVDLSAVQIMSIHHSKGCEYNYVFLVDTSHRFNTRDQTSALVCESDLGVALKLRAKDSFWRYDTLLRRVIGAKIRENTVDEEMRVLYVALTRAKKQLIIAASVGGKGQKTLESFTRFVETHSDFCHPQLFEDCLCYAEWLALATDDPAITTVQSLSFLPSQQPSVLRENDAQSTALSIEELEKRLSFRYPHAEVATLPTKLSVSRLYPGILDDEAEELIRADKADFDRLPLFMQEKGAASSAERGTATHLFMQFCDFDRVRAGGVDAEIRRLVEKAFITEGIASLIDRAKLAVFFRSDLFARICAAEEVFREERFNVRLEASEFTLDPHKAKVYENESVLVQGVVDCLIREKDGSFVLIDYKTDHTPKDRAAAESMLRKRYTTQLSYYRRAVEIVYGMPVKKTLLYSFGLGDTVEIK